MEDWTIVLLGLIALTGLYLSVRELRLYRTVKYRVGVQKTAAARAAREPVQVTGGEVVPDWMYEVAESLGFNLDDFLESEEMPAELATLLPMAKGFVETGGLKKLLEGAKENQTAAAGPFL